MLLKGPCKLECHQLNTMEPKLNCHHVADNIFQYIFLKYQYLPPVVELIMNQLMTEFCEAYLLHHAPMNYSHIQFHIHFNNTWVCSEIIKCIPTCITCVWFVKSACKQYNTFRYYYYMQYIYMCIYINIYINIYMLHIIKHANRLAKCGHKILIDSCERKMRLSLSNECSRPFNVLTSLKTANHSAILLGLSYYPPPWLPTDDFKRNFLGYKKSYKLSSLLFLNGFT